MAKKSNNPTEATAADQLSSVIASHSSGLERHLLQRFGHVPASFIQSNNKPDLKDYVQALAARESNPDEFIKQICWHAKNS